ncbi:MAG: diacylglycerol kinase family protein [Elusimicrobiales bacterium]|nr:diacylglycerol kinase family protein [Elusimicrobiales bacterium]
MKFLLILNPGSRSGRGRDLWPWLQERLTSAGVRFRAAVTEAPGDAVKLAREAAPDETPVAVGGDGTINGVLDGLLQAGRQDPVLGVFYTGTSPDFCRFNGVPTEPEAALRALLEGASAPRDAARVTYRGCDGAGLTAHFGCSCNIGLGAAVARGANRSRRWLGDAWGTGLAVLAAAAGRRPADLVLLLDGQPYPLRVVDNLTVAKNPHIASGLKLALDLRPDDGRLCALAVHGKSALGLLRLVPGFYSGKAAEDPSLFLRFCSKIEVRSAAPCEVEFDGDPRGLLPAEIEILPKVYRLIGARP